MELMEIIITENPEYQITEIGLIPRDWIISELGKLGSLSKGRGIKKDQVEPHGTPCVRYGELYTRYENIITKFFSFINDDVAKGSYLIKEGDILFAGSGETKEEIGKCAAVLFSKPVYAGGDIIVFRPHKDNSVFLGYLLNSPPIVKQKSAKGQGDAVVHIYSSSLYQIKVLLPPSLEEQSAIATALNDVDNLIRSLDKLIAKKNAIKQSAMQQLLKYPKEGGKRLPEFDGEWVLKQLEDISDIKSGKRLPLGKKLTDSVTPHPYIRVADMFQGGINPKEIKYVPEDVFPAIENYRIFRDDIFISVAGTLGIVGRIPDELDGANLTENANRFTNITCDRDFLLFILMSPVIQNKIDSSRTIGAQPKLALTRIRTFTISLPPTGKEQKAISSIILDMEREIKALESKRLKYIRIKQGMMQQLLTGKTRLV